MFERITFDGLEKSLKCILSVIPAKAGIQRARHGSIREYQVYLFEKEGF